MTDIVTRLREGVFGTDETKTDAVIHSHMQAAADEIERLRAALRSIVADCEAQCPHWSIRDDARAALGKNNHD